MWGKIAISCFLLLLFPIAPAAQTNDGGASDGVLAIKKRPALYDASHGNRPLPWRFGGSLNGAFSTPYDNKWSPVEAGFGFDGDFFVAVGPFTSIRLSLGRSGLTAEGEADYRTAAIWPPYERLLSRKRDMTALRYFASIQANSNFDEMAPGNFLFYIYAGLGGVRHDIESSTTIINDSTGQVFTYSSNYDETTFATTLGAGMTYLILPHFGLDVRLSSDFIFTDDNIVVTTAPYGADYLTRYDGTFDIRVGVTALF